MGLSIEEKGGLAGLIGFLSLVVVFISALLVIATEDTLYEMLLYIFAGTTVSGLTMWYYYFTKHVQHLTGDGFK